MFVAPLYTTTYRPRASAWLTFLIPVLLIGCASYSDGDSVPQEVGADRQKATAVTRGDEFAVVDCLLPGQIRRLGAHVTYLTARRPIRTTAEDCTIRGGEYVASDRADYATALKVWLDPAQEGDPQAEYYVATIYEKGPKGKPDYELAATWYRKAADQGYGRAAINLGRLYEKGLGVTRSPSEAFRWYARASGLDESNLSMLVNEEAAGRIQTLSRTLADREHEIQNLQAGLNEVNQRLGKLRGQVERRKSVAEVGRRKLQELEQQYQSARIELDKARAKSDQSAIIARYQENLGGLTQELAQRQRKLEDQDREITRLHDNIATLKETADHIRTLEREMEARERESQHLRAQLAVVNQELVQLRPQLQERAAVADQARQRLQQMEEQYRSVKAKLGKALANQGRQMEVRRYKRELEKLDAELGERQRAVEKRDEEIAQFRQRIIQLEAEAQNRVVELAASPDTDLGLQGPTIEILDPPLVMTRDIKVEKRRLPVSIQAGGQRAITGRVLSPAGLRSLLVNGQQMTVDENGIFTVEVPILRSGQREIPMDILAVDIQNKRAVVRLLVSPRGSVTAASGALTSVSFRFGRYYALVIGNDRYRYWDPLKNAVTDATAVAAILRDHYGFEVRLLKNATRQDILRALNRYRKTLTEKDNLLIYYAGHGYLEPEIDRGYWIPVDAQLDDNSDWILLPTITDLLQLMSVKHVLVVADSCFAGKLTRGSLAKLRPGLTEDERLTMLKTLSENRVRTALTSGGVRPVMDTGGGGHSVFANAFLGVLEENLDILEAERLFWAVRTRVIRSARRFNVEQIPTYSPIHLAGHESLGDFIFVPQKS